MTTVAQHQKTTSIDPATQVGALSLTVSDLARSIEYYRDDIGLAVLSQSGSGAVLGVGEHPLLELEEVAGAAPWPRGGRSYTGLYHLAILLPTRKDLGRWLKHWLDLGHPMPGQGDHLVSEALYLEDPDGHGIEMYRDRPRDQWEWTDGQVRMATDPVDVRGLLDEADEAGQIWNGMPDGSKLGHIHLQVGDIPQADAFYHGVLGFDIVVQMPTALFLSAGGYHHHIGMNIWHSKGAGPGPTGTVGLRSFSVVFATGEARQEVLKRIESAGLDITRLANGDAVVYDPWQNKIALQVG
jgi:catechol 2,3-dioxygenase